MRDFFIILICAIMLLNSLAIAAAETKIPAMLIRGETERPVSLILEPSLLIKGGEEDSLYLDSSVKKIKLVAKNEDFREELKVFKKYRFQYAMYAGIIFAGLFFVVVNK